MCVIGNSYFSSCSCTSAGISLLVSTLMFSNFAARFTAAHPSSSNTPVSTRSTNETSGSRRSGIPSVESNPLKMKFLFNFSCVHVNSFNHSVCLTIWFFLFFILPFFESLSLSFFMNLLLAKWRFLFRIYFRQAEMEVRHYGPAMAVVFEDDKSCVNKGGERESKWRKVWDGWERMRKNKTRKERSWVMYVLNKVIKMAALVACERAGTLKSKVISDRLIDRRTNRHSNV